MLKVNFGGLNFFVENKKNFSCRKFCIVKYIFIGEITQWHIFSEFYFCVEFSFVSPGLLSTIHNQTKNLYQIFPTFWREIV